MAKIKDACVNAAAGPIQPAGTPPQTQVNQTREALMFMARVGKEAPDFEATAYIARQGFKNVKLSDYRGKWIVLCFYPGDFTFV